MSGERVWTETDGERLLAGGAIIGAGLVGLVAVVCGVEVVPWAVGALVAVSTVTIARANRADRERYP